MTQTICEEEGGVVSELDSKNGLPLNTMEYHCLEWALELYRLGQKKVSNLDNTEALNQILIHIVSGFSAASGCLALKANNKQELTIVAGIDLPPAVIGRTIRFGEGILGKVAETSKPVLINGDFQDNGRSPEREGDLRPRSAMCWPLKGEEEIIGVVSINRIKEQTPFTENDMKRGMILIQIISMVLENARLHRRYQRQIQDLEQMNFQMKVLNKKFEETHNQLLQSEKMASIGQLAAGVAHEINNPVGYVYSNLGSLKRYVEDLFKILEVYENVEALLETDAETKLRMEEIKQEVDLEFLKQDLVDLVRESQEGVTRVKQIVQDLKDFSHAEGADWQWADLHKGLDSTLNIVWNELKYKSEIVKEYGALPMVECMPSQINQVLMNLLVNAAQAIEEQGIITIRTGSDKEWVWIEISDTGKGISEENINRIFEPFFTTKPVGKGTGLGLSLSYGIVHKHGGQITVKSELNKGSTFRIRIPIQQGNAA